jgi:hypothetical protein
LCHERTPPSVDVNQIQSVGELEYGGLEDVNQGGEDLSLDRLIRDLGFDRAMEIVQQNQAIADKRKAAEAAALAPRPVENQELSFGLGAADLPTTDTDLSFGGITPSAADIPLSTGVEPSGEPTPEFPLGTPATVPETAQNLSLTVVAALAAVVLATSAPLSRALPACWKSVRNLLRQTSGCLLHRLVWH